MILRFLIKRRFSLIAFSYWFFAGLLPLTTILLEFGWEEGFTYASFYSPLYFYPLIFGPIAVFFFLRPVFFLFSLPKNQRFNLGRQGLLGFILVMTLIVSFLEFSSNPAVWEVKKVAIVDTINTFNSSTPNREISQWADFYHHFLNHPEDPKNDDFDSVKEANNERERLSAVREEFNEIIVTASKSIRNWSVTRWFYFLSFLIQLLAVFFEFMTISFISMPRFQEQFVARENWDIALIDKTQNSLPRQSGEWLLRKHLILLSCSLMFTLAWLYMRIPFDIDKMNLYGVDLISISASTMVIGVFYVLAAVYITIRLFITYDEKMPAFLNAIGVVLGAFVTVLSSQINGNVLGSEATPQNYLALLITVVIVLFPWYVAYRDLLSD